MKDANPLEWIDAAIHSDSKKTIDLSPKDQKYTIAVDMVHQIVESLDPLVNYGAALESYEYDGGKIVFEKMKFCSKMFNAGYRGFMNGKPFLKVSVDPKKNGVLKDNTIKVELENNVLYEVGFLDDLKAFYSKMKWRVKNSSRIDIALDGRGFFDVWEKYTRGEIARKGNGNKEQEFRISSGGRRILTGFDVGSRASDKWITCYNKSADIERTNKGYIRRFWERSGLDTQHVERMELKLRNDALKEVNFDWQRLDDFEYLASIFRTFIEGGFVDLVDQSTGELFRKRKAGILNFIEVNDDKNVSRKRRIRFINWDYIGAVPLERLSTEKTNEVWATKVTIKKIVQLAIACDRKANSPFERDREMYKERSVAFLCQAYELAENINCIDWYIDHFEEWKAGFDKQRLDYIPYFRVSAAGEQLRLTSNPIPEALSL